MNRFIKTAINIVRILVGLVFIFSGFVKGIDPLGSAYKFTEYFEVIGLNDLDNISLILSFLLSWAEFIVGIALVFGLVMNFTAWVSVCFMSFFTILTFLLALFNPVSDCGCFGDAIKLTNWETFFKNVILIAVVLLIFFQRKKFKIQISLPFQWSIAILASIIFLGLQQYSYKHLPVIDFMPYSVGTSIPDKMAIPANAPRDEYKTALFYKKEGVVKEFNESNFPWQDSTWKFVDSKSVLIKAGYKPAIHDFSINTPDGINITDSILTDTAYIFLFIAKRAQEIPAQTYTFTDSLSKYCQHSGAAKFIATTASNSAVIDSIKSNLQLNYSFNTTDETTLKTIIRAKAGLLLIKNGVIIGKWHYNDFNTINYKHSNLLSYSITLLNNNNKMLFERAFFGLLGILLVLILCIGINKKKND